MANDTTPFPTSTSRIDETGTERLAHGQLNEGGVPPPGMSEGGAQRGDDMLARVVQGAHQTIDRLAESAAPHVHRLSEGLDSRSGQVREMSEEWTESLRTTVREHPLAAVATALAVGMLIARISR